MAERKLPTADDLPNNSDHKPAVVEKKERPEAVQSVVKGKVKTKESGLRKMRDEFVSEDAGNVGSYILWDVLVPAVRDTILDILHGSIDMAFGNGGGYYRRGSHSRSSRNDRSYISYDRMYDDRDRERDRRRREDRRTRDQLEDLIFEYREDAEDVLDRMCDYLDRYDDVPVSYLYDLCGKTVPHDFTKDDWGWTNLSSAKVMRARGGGYYIDFPKVRPI